MDLDNVLVHMQFTYITYTIVGNFVPSVILCHYITQGFVLTYNWLSQARIKKDCNR